MRLNPHHLLSLLVSPHVAHYQIRTIYRRDGYGTTEFSTSTSFESDSTVLTLLPPDPTQSASLVDPPIVISELPPEFTPSTSLTSESATDSSLPPDSSTSLSRVYNTTSYYETKSTTFEEPVTTDTATTISSTYSRDCDISTGCALPTDCINVYAAPGKPVSCIPYSASDTVPQEPPPKTTDSNPEDTSGAVTTSSTGSMTASPVSPTTLATSPTNTNIPPTSKPSDSLFNPDPAQPGPASKVFIPGAVLISLFSIALLASAGFLCWWRRTRSPRKSEVGEFDEKEIGDFEPVEFEPVELPERSSNNPRELPTRSLKSPKELPERTSRFPRVFLERSSRHTSRHSSKYSSKHSSKHSSRRSSKHLKNLLERSPKFPKELLELSSKYSKELLERSSKYPKELLERSLSKYSKDLPLLPESSTNQRGGAQGT